MEQYLTLASAIEMITGLRRASVKSSLEAMIGLAKEGVEIAADDNRWAHTGWFRADLYSEEAIPLEEFGSPIVLETLKNFVIPCDFWTAGMAATLAHEHQYRRGYIRMRRECNYAQLPYRMVKNGRGTARFAFTAEAKGVMVHQDAIAQILAEHDWDRWRSIFPARRRGPAPMYAWDAMKARLTMEGRERPQLLDGDVPSLVDAIQWVWDELSAESVDDIPEPDLSDLYRYARKLVVARNRIADRHSEGKRDIAPPN